MASLITVHSPSHAPNNRRAPSNGACRVSQRTHTARPARHSTVRRRGAEPMSRHSRSLSRWKERPLAYKTRPADRLYEHPSLQGVPARVCVQCAGPARNGGVGQKLLSMPTARDMIIPPGRVKCARGMGPILSARPSTDMPAQISQNSETNQNKSYKL
jgi:hypothetical protein